jgi:hypothetical protein
MLRGFAIECLLKAIWLKKGNLLTRDQVCAQGCALSRHQGPVTSSWSANMRLVLVRSVSIAGSSIRLPKFTVRREMCGQRFSRLVRSLERPAVRRRARNVRSFEEYRMRTRARSGRVIPLRVTQGAAAAAGGREFPDVSIRRGAHRPTTCQARRARALPQEFRSRRNPSDIADARTHSKARSEPGACRRTESTNR